MADADPLAAVVERAVGGDADALEDVCGALQDPIYRLAMRMFSHPEDAADATQEALIRVVTNLASFEGRSKVTSPSFPCLCNPLSPLQPVKTAGPLS